MNTFKASSRGGATTALIVALSIKEIVRNRGRFTLVSAVVALITVLVLFIAGIAEGLGSGNKQYLEKLNADLVVYQSGVELSLPASRLSWAKLEQIRGVDGVVDAGLVGFSTASIVQEGAAPLNISLIGVEPGRPGEPPVERGRGLQGESADEVIIDRNVALRTGLKEGDALVLKTIQRAEEQRFTLRVVGVSDGRQHFLQPSAIVPARTWQRIRPGDVPTSAGELIMNMVAVRLASPDEQEAMAQRLAAEVTGVEAVDRVRAYEATPGYAAQQSTLNTQKYFSLLISLLVIGGFFQIQMLQKLGHIGVLKAIGASTRSIVLASLLQILIVTLLGVALGGLGVLGLTLVLPPTIPIIFTPASTALALAALLLVGPLGGLFSVRAAMRVEPITALRMSA